MPRDGLRREIIVGEGKLPEPEDIGRLRRGRRRDHSGGFESPFPPTIASCLAAKVGLAEVTLGIFPGYGEAAISVLRHAIANPVEWRERRRRARQSVALQDQMDADLLKSARTTAAKTLAHHRAAHDAVELLEAGAALDRDAALVLEAQQRPSQTWGHYAARRRRQRVV